MEELGFRFTAKDDAGKVVDKLTKRIQHLDSAWDSLSRRRGSISQAIKQENKELQRQRALFTGLYKEQRRFKGELLSTMFFGMALQRVFGGFLMSAIDTFQNVVNGTSRANNGITQLQAAWEFFKFSLIDALVNSGAFNYFVGVVMQLVDWWGNLSDRTKTWIVWLIAGVAVIGAFLAFVGLVGLGLIGLVDTYGLLFGQQLLINGELVKVPGLLTKIGTAFKAAFAWSAAHAALLGIIGGILIAAGFIIYLGVKLGGLLELAKSIGRGIARVFVFLASVIVASFAEAWNAIKMGWNATIDLFQSGVNKVIEYINRLIRKWNSIPGTKKISELGSIDFSGAKAQIESFGDEWTKVYDGMMTKYFDWEAKALPSQNGYLQTWSPFSDMSGITSPLTEDITGGVSDSSMVNSGNTIVQNNVINVSQTAQAGQQINSNLNDNLARLGLGQYALT